ncbi:unnamed protein product [Ilex paraguariensis]|uniref:SAGA-associated factor 11 n=1 Tax=Ilex paraguariensis TaxID=185542 RepID=A0ABC8SX28_9AQUA
MAAMARLLEAGSVSQTIADGVGHPKLAAQYILRELREADEANLVDEEDMHVFDLRPMTDPLHLVRCNACKRPVRASQYAAHAEICKSLSFSEELMSELDGGRKKKKPPRKEKKKSLTACAVREQERPVSLNANDSAASKFHLDEQIQATSSFGLDAKCREYCKGSSAQNEKPCGHDVGYQVQIPRQVHGCCLPAEAIKSDIPVPLATKVFYSQSNLRLRSALSHLYYEASAKEHCSDLLKGNAMPSWSSTPNNFSHEQNDDQQEKRMF